MVPVSVEKLLRAIDIGICEILASILLMGAKGRTLPLWVVTCPLCSVFHCDDLTFEVVHASLLTRQSSFGNHIETMAFKICLVHYP